MSYYFFGPPTQSGGPFDWVEDFIVHELTHARQASWSASMGGNERAVRITGSKFAVLPGSRL